MFTSQYRRLRFLTRILLVVLLTGFASGPGQSKVKPDTPRAAVTLSQPLTIRWRYDSGLSLNLTPAFDAERIYIPLAGGVVVALRARDGELTWRSEMGGELSASPVAAEDQIYIASETGNAGGAKRSTGVLRAIGREGGVTQWMTPLVMPLHGSLTVSGGKVFA